MKFRPALGESDFRKIREAGYGYIDKTSFISQVLDDTSSALLFPRPRRFGKTLNISTLGYFLRKTDEDLTHLFAGLDVTRDAQAMQHFQKYPTIFVTFKEVKSKTLAGAMTGIREQITAAFDAHRHLLDDPRISPSIARKFRSVLDGTAADDELQYSFKWLTQTLHEHYKIPVVVLIDEYDTPIQSGYMYGYFDDMVLFFRNFFSGVFKDNVSLFKGVLTGILRVSKENMFSGLNNIEVYSILSQDYATYFGFTEQEVGAIIEPERLEEVRAWYNGYLFGDITIYNPWSILSYLKHEKLKPYWVNTGSSDLIELLATRKGAGLTVNSEALLRGETIEVQVDDNVVLRDIEFGRDALWNFLLMSGYLKLAKLDLVHGRYYGELCIPNKEIRLVYQDMFRNWLDRVTPSPAYIDELVKSLFTGDAATLQEILEVIMLRALSYQDPGGREPEKLYHGLILGLLVHLESQYDVRSNREAGLGRADVLIRPKTPGRPGVVLELKACGPKDKPSDMLDAATKQIRDRQYAAEVAAAGASHVYEYAMVFDGKQAWVKRVDEMTQ